MQNFTTISPNLLQPRIPELGKIKIGGKGKRKTSSGGKQFRLPQKFDHFVVTTRMKDNSDNWVRDAAVHETVGAEPKELDVRLMFDEPDQNFQYFLAAYDGQTKRCSGNGETAHDREHGQIPCTCPWLKVHEGPYAGPARKVGRGAPTCKPHGRLSVVLEAAKTYGGFYVFRTTSWESIRSIAAQLQTFRDQFGFLAGLPLRMVIYPAKDVTPDGTFESYKVALVVRASMDSALQLATQAHERRKMLPKGAMPEVHQAQLLEAEESEAQDIAGEYHPETSPAEDEAEDAVAEEEEAEALLEDELRLTFELLEWDATTITKQVAKYSDDLTQLEAIVQEKAPKELEMAREELARIREEAEAEEEPDQEEAEGVDAEMEPADAEAPVLEGEIETEDEPAEADTSEEQPALW